MLPLDYIQDNFIYCPEAKGLINKINRRPKGKAGQRAGSVHRVLGYRFISIGGIPTTEQRVVWALVKNEQPPTQIGRHNEDKLDNRIENLFAIEIEAPRDFTHAELLDLVSYDPEEGVLVWKKRLGNNCPVGSSATCDSHGYTVIRIFKNLYPAHRVIWFYMTGTWPEREIDHKDRNRSNNTWGNLRLASQSENCGNQPDKPQGNQTGFRGVSSTGKSFAAHVMKGRVKHKVGLFKTAAEAHEAYKKKHLELHGEFSIYNQQKGN